MTCLTGDVCSELAEKLAKVERQRDEARADVERLKELFGA